MDESTLRLRHPDSLGQAFLWALLPTLALVLIAPSLGDAQVQVTTSITSTPGAGNLATTITHAGDLYNITGGTRPGNGPNLFHSFGDFSVGGGDIGNFLNNTGLPTSNILGRVTGGNTSNIDGIVQTTGFGNANLFLVNPSGIVFGPHGSLDVGGSVSFTTVQYLRLFDGVNSANFYTNPANDGLANSVLAVAPVVDFGFLSPAAYGFLTPPDPSATITVQGSALSVPSGQSISLVGGKVVIQGSTLPDGTVQPAHLSALNGTIQLASTASPGEFDVATLQPLPNVNDASFTSFGSVSLAPGSSIDVSGPRTVFVKGGQLVLSVNDATLSTTEGSVPSDTVSLSPGSSIVTSNSGPEPGADAQITVGTLQMMDGAPIQSTTTGDGSGGNITADVGTLALTNGAMISSNNLFGLGQGGNVTVQGLQGSGSPAANVSLDNSMISTTIDGGTSSTTPATIDITAQTVNLANGAEVNAETHGAAPAGDITLNVDTLTVGNSTISTSSSSTDSTAGNAGTITIQGITGAGSSAATVSLDFSEISTQISGGSQDNTPAAITITAHTLDLANGAFIGADTSGAGPAGDITLDVDTLTVGNSQISSRSNSLLTDSTAGNAGNITIQGITGSGSPAASVSFDRSFISTDIFGGSAANTPATITITAQTLALADTFMRADTSSLAPAGDITFAAPAGDITLNVDTLTVGNSNITTDSFSSDSMTAHAGNITIQGITGSGSPAANVSLDGGMISTQIFGGNAASTPGAITITAQTLTLPYIAFIGADTSGAAPSGDIALNVDTLTAGFFSRIFSNSNSTDPTAGNAGTITIQGITGAGSSAATVSLDFSEISTQISGGSQDNTPAAITITAHTLDLANGAFIGADTSGAGPAGDITLDVDTLTVGNSQISSRSNSLLTDSTAGNAGNITIQGITGSGSPAASVSFDRSFISTDIFGGSAANTPATITITAQTLALADTFMRADTSSLAPAGDITFAAPAGDITLNVDTLTVGNSNITTDSFSSDSMTAHAGNITIQGITGSGSPAANVSLDGGMISTQIFGGNAASTPGAITITAQTLTLPYIAFIGADTSGAAPSGDIALNVDTLTAGFFSRIFSNSNSTDPTAGNAGTITIQGITGAGSSATNLNLDSSTISTTISGGNALSTPATIDITAQTVNLTRDAQIKAATSGAAPAGDITLNVGTLTAGTSTISSASTLANSIAGDAGQIMIQGLAAPGSPASSVNLDNSTISTTISGGRSISTNGLPANTPGSISITAETVKISGDFKGLDAETTGMGQAGDISIKAATVEIAKGAFVGTDSSGGGRAGNIFIQATDHFLYGTESQSLFNTMLTTSNQGSGGAGAIIINTPNLVISNFAQINSDTGGTGSGGSIELNVSKQLAITSGGSINSATNDQRLGAGGPVVSPVPAGSGGTISITSPLVVLSDRASLNSETNGSGQAGNIRLNVDQLIVAGTSVISSSSVDSASTASNAGNAGQITIQGLAGPGSPATSVNLDNSTISTTISGGRSISTNGLPANTAGSIGITAETVNLTNGAKITADTSGAAPAGNIAVNVDTLTAGNSTISSSSSPAFIDVLGVFSEGGGNAGSITIQGITGSGSPAANVSLDNGTISTTIDGGSSSTTPATIDITAQTVNLANGAQIKADTSGAAPAGNIALNVDTLTAGILTEISSTSIPTDSTAGNAGSITIQGITGPGSSATNVSLKGNTSFGNEFCCKVIITTIAGGTSSTTPATIDITAQTVNLANGAQISAETDGAAPAGNIALNVGTLTADNFSVISSGSGHRGDPAAGNAGNITIQGINGSGSPAANVSLLDFSEIRSETFGGSAANTAANIDITAQTLALAHGGIRADAEGTAPAGNITFNVSKLTVDSSSISSSSFLFDFVSLDSAAGNAGTITIQGINGSGSSAANVSLLDFTGINTLTVGGSTANTPATITITAQKLTLANAVIAADTFGAAPAGDITLNVGTLTADNFSVIESGSSHFELSLDPTVGKAGNITIQGITGSPAGNVSLDGTTISTRTTGSANTAANIDITAQTLALTNFATIEADTFGAAPAGNITLNVGTLTASDSLGGFILKGIISNSLVNETLEGTPAGNAGNITIQGVTGPGSSAANVRLDNSNISTRIFSGSAANTPANIVIAAQAVTLSNGADITASTSGNAPAGNIKVVTQQLTMTPDSTITSNALDGGVATTGKAGSITITGAGSAPTTIAGGSIQAQSETSASAGDITLQAPGDLTLLGTTVSVKNTGAGNAGSIDLRAGNDLLVRNSQVSTESAKASGGNIKLTAPNLVHIVDSTINSSVQGQAGSNGGNINIDPQWVVIQNSQLLANANAGAGGNITIAASSAVVIDPNSLLSASAGPAGVSGSVNIIAPFQVLGGILVPLNQSFSQASLSGDRCAADPTGQFSSFVQIGRDGVPQVPGALSPSPLSFLETLTSGSLGSPGPNWAATRLGLDSISFGDSTRFHSACRS